MRPIRVLLLLGLPLSILVEESPTVLAAAPAQIDFVRDVEPILRAHCYDCHGPDAQEGQLRLDAREEVASAGGEPATERPTGVAVS